MWKCSVPSHYPKDRRSAACLCEPDRSTTKARAGQKRDRDGDGLWRLRKDRSALLGTGRSEEMLRHPCPPEPSPENRSKADSCLTLDLRWSGVHQNLGLGPLQDFQHTVELTRLRTAMPREGTRK